MNSVALLIAGCAILSQTNSDSVPPPREIAAGVFCIGSSNRFESANFGAVVDGDQVVLIGSAAPELAERTITQIEGKTGSRVSTAVVTHMRGNQTLEMIRTLVARHITVLMAQRTAGQLQRLEQQAKQTVMNSAKIQTFAVKTELKIATRSLEIAEWADISESPSVTVFVRDEGVLFTGELCYNGPRAVLAGHNSEMWIRALARLSEWPVKTVVPGFGRIGGATALDRQRRYLLELRRQIAMIVARGQPLEAAHAGVQIAPEWLVWMPYDHPNGDDIEHVYRELTVPAAPFGARPPDRDTRPHTLALIGDRVHDPAHLEDGLRGVFEPLDLPIWFTFDVRSLSAENLKQVQLFVILRDGMIWPDGPEKPHAIWMTPEQERAIVEFVEGGGSLLALHNSTGLYPEGGPYLKLVGGTYNGHGPLERFRVRATDASHPITRGVEEYEIADEQHTPVPDLKKVHILLESRSDEGIVAPAGWAYEAGRGRVCYLANGHTRGSLAHPTYQALLQNAVRWCLRSDGIPK